MVLLSRHEALKKAFYCCLCRKKLKQKKYSLEEEKVMCKFATAFKAKHKYVFGCSCFVLLIIIIISIRFHVIPYGSYIIRSNILLLATWLIDSWSLF